MKILWAVAAVFVCILFFTFAIYSTVSRPVSFVINPGDSVNAVSKRVSGQKLVMNDSVFKIAIRLHGGRVQAGEYEIPRGASVWKIAKMFSHGKIATVDILIPEGLTIRQIRDLLAESVHLSGDTECDSQQRWGDVCQASDGDIFPDTYRVARGTSRMAVLDLAYKKMQTIKNKFYASGNVPPAPLKNWNDVLILASIVQRETPKVSEMRIVASVYLNRLRRGMRLQADPTVIYALTDGYGDMQGAPLLRDHLKIDSPYNTYRNNGLPPAPIANVGMHAIRAVMNPANTNYLFFVADGRGGHKFSTDFDQHLKNRLDWREIKRQKNPELQEVFK